MINIGIAAGFDKQAHHGAGVNDLAHSRAWGSITLKRREEIKEPNYWFDSATNTSYNAKGLPNQGIRSFAENDLPLIAAAASRTPTRQRLSLAPTGAGTLRDMLNILRSCTYLSSLAELEINAACPNTRTGKNLEPVLALDPVAIRQLLMETDEWNGQVPLALKIAPDTPDETLATIVDLCLEFKVGAIVSGNTRLTSSTIDSVQRLSVETCGQAGGVLFEAALDQLQRLRRIVNEKQAGLRLVACGGVMHPANVMAYEELGADEIQLATYYQEFGFQGLRDMMMAMT